MNCNFVFKIANINNVARAFRVHGPVGAGSGGGAARRSFTSSSWSRLSVAEKSSRLSVPVAATVSSVALLTLGGYAIKQHLASASSTSSLLEALSSSSLGALLKPPQVAHADDGGSHTKVTAVVPMAPGELVIEKVYTPIQVFQPRVLSIWYRGILFIVSVASGGLLYFFLSPIVRYNHLVSRFSSVCHLRKQKQKKPRRLSTKRITSFISLSSIDCLCAQEEVVSINFAVSHINIRLCDSPQVPQMKIGSRKLAWRGEFSAYYREAMINLLYGVITLGIHPVRLINLHTTHMIHNNMF